MAHFTREEVEEMGRRLAVLAVKDTQLPEADPISGDEEVAIIQDGKNKRVKVTDISSGIDPQIHANRKMTIYQSHGGLVMYGEDEDIEVRIEDGYGVDVTDEYSQFILERDSGDPPSDTVWNASHRDVGNTFTILFTDLRIDYIHTRSNKFTVTAVSSGIQNVSATLEYEY